MKTILAETAFYASLGELVMIPILIIVIAFCLQGIGKLLDWVFKK